MVLQTIKFSEFIDGGDLANDEQTAGLFTGTNALFNNPWTFLAPGTTAARPAPSAAIYYRLRLNTTSTAYEYYDPVLLTWVQLASSGTGFVWQEITTSPTAMLPDRGYVVNFAGLEVLSLPLLSVVGDEIAITGKSATGWQLIQAAGQSINFGFYTTTVGTMGYLQSNAQFDSVRLVCTTANLTWNVISSIGNITIA
jgi:hypothetical protein